MKECLVFFNREIKSKSKRGDGGGSLGRGFKGKSKGVRERDHRFAKEAREVPIISK